MNNEFIVHTGSIIKEYLEEMSISHKECAKQMGISEKYFSNLLNGKEKLTEDVALRLESIFHDVPASYWLNYESKYRQHLEREKVDYQTYTTEQLNELSKRFMFNKVFKGLDWDLVKQANEML